MELAIVTERGMVDFYLLQLHDWQYACWYNYSFKTTYLRVGKYLSGEISLCLFREEPD